ncbi:hypothetical protein [Prauserella cavernicola]|uniref:Uncharacterized protein n=1 Tax=Prauserella cavernicola TaxID=2800127 RepID=A0A934R064_9PSEU|nr:hypothetical protein [Prauserella cavernicola]MBK1788489.1 hypothetical protein [Prauserella cavernicola]
MEQDNVGAVIGELTAWADKADRVPALDLDDAELALQLLSDELGVHDLAQLEPGQLDELLLGIYPEAVEPGHAPAALVALHHLLTFAGETGRLDEAAVAALRGELDEIEPELSDGEVNLKEAYGLPDRIGPLRLPADDELAATARGIAVLERARELAVWCGDGRATVESVGLDDEDRAAAAAELGRSEEDIVQLYLIAEDIGFIVPGEDGTLVGESVQDFPDGADEDVLELWDQAFAATLAWSLLTDADLAGEEALDFEGAGAWFMPLFLSRHRGLPTPAISEMIFDLATEELVADEARQRWDEWVRVHGDPAEVLLARLTELGAVEVTEGIVRATPLAVAAMREELVESGVDVPVLPPEDEMTAADLIEVGLSGMDGELEVEAEVWLVRRTGDAAAAELLAVAAEGGAAERTVAAGLIRERIGAEAEAQWRAALDVPVLSRHAKASLELLLGPDPEFAASEDDAAWLVVDELAGTVHGVAEGDLPMLLDASFAPQYAPLFERMWRLDHPDAHEVLTLLGTHHPDKATAKRARAAAHKAAGRAGSGQATPR